MDDIETTLLRLRTLPAPDRLSLLDAGAIADQAMDQRRADAATGPALGLAGLAALAIGVAAAMLPDTVTPAPALIAGASLAPSTLLADVG